MQVTFDTNNLAEVEHVFHLVQDIRENLRFPALPQAAALEHTLDFLSYIGEEGRYVLCAALEIPHLEWDSDTWLKVSRLTPRRFRSVLRKMVKVSRTTGWAPFNKVRSENKKHYYQWVGEAKKALEEALVPR